MNDEYDIAKAFRRIEETLIESMKRNLTRHLNEEAEEGFRWSMWQAEQLKSLEKFRSENKTLFKKDFSTINTDVEELIKKGYEDGKLNQERLILEAIQNGTFDSENKKISKLWHIYKNTNNKRIRKKQLTRIFKEVNNAESTFFRINENKLKELIKETTGNLRQAESSILRYTNDQYRKIIYDAQVYANTGSGTLQQSIDMATKDFLSKGINNIEYSDGRMVNIASYVEMAIRTANTRATLYGEGLKRDEWGIHTVLVPNRGGGCPYCIKFQGKVFIDDVYSNGTEEESKIQGYPLLSFAVKQRLFHPNCKDTLVTYFPNVNTKLVLPTAEEIERKRQNYIKEQKLNYIDRNIDKYKRLELGSLDNENIEKYHNKRLEWQEYKRKFKKNNELSYYDVNNLKKTPNGSIIKLSDDEQYALNQYLSAESYNLNEAFRKESDLTEQQETMKTNLDKALKKFPKYEGEVTRSLELDSEMLKEFLNVHKEENIIEYKAYTSTTTGTRYNDNSNVELHIKSKNGRDIRQFNNEEQEVLFERDSKFKVVKLEKIEEVYHIKMKEL